MDMTKNGRIPNTTPARKAVHSAGKEWNHTTFTQQDAAELAEIEASLNNPDQGLDSENPHDQAYAVAKHMGTRNRRVRRDYLLKKKRTVEREQ